LSAARRQTVSGAKAAVPLERFKAEYWPHYAAVMKKCENRLAQAAGESGRLLAESCSSTLTAGGKRLRPLLVFLSARRQAPAGNELIAAATAVELVHMATLVHDDVLDGAELRRGLPTLAAKYGSEVSTAAGDYLFASAFEVLISAGSEKAISLLAQTSLDLSLGELVQMEQTRDFSLRPEAYAQRCRLKTAGLFSAACMLGALLSGCSQGAVTAIDNFGMHLGLAFQLADDILDFTADESDLGKRAGADLRDGTVTLPLMIAIARDGSLVEAIVNWHGSGSDDGEIADLCRRVIATGATEAAYRQAREHVDCAIEALAEVEAEMNTEPLALIAEMAADRKV